MTANHQVVFAPKFRVHLLDRSAHFPYVIFTGEIY
jgi:hypothetical protein